MSTTGRHCFEPGPCSSRHRPWPSTHEALKQSSMWQVLTRRKVPCRTCGAWIDVDCSGLKAKSSERFRFQVVERCCLNAKPARKDSLTGYSCACARVVRDLQSSNYILRAQAAVGGLCREPMSCRRCVAFGCREAGTRIGRIASKAIQTLEQEHRWLSESQTASCVISWGSYLGGHILEVSLLQSQTAGVNAKSRIMEWCPTSPMPTSNEEQVCQIKSAVCWLSNRFHCSCV